MKNAGLAHLTFGVESGDDRILRVIRKGTTTSQVVRALEWSKEEGLSTACSFMLGFPEDTPASLERTARFMERIAPLVDSFGTLGVVIPFPGTPLYEANHSRYGFTDWWLREEYSRYTAFPPVTDVERFHRHYIDDANLELDFFRYGSGTRDLIRACLKIKGEHNLRKIGLFRDSAIQSPPSVEPASWDHPDTARYFEQFTRCHTRYLAANRALVRHAALAPGQRLLDFGAGTGGTSACALEQIGSDGRIDCVEPAGAMRQIGQTKFDARVRWFAGLPPDTERYDRILCGAAIWQVPDLKLCIRNLVSRLMPGGAICFNIPAAYVGLPDGPGGGRDPWLTELPASLVRRVPAAILPQRPRLRLPSPSELSGLLESCGLVACSWSYTGRLTQKSYRDWLKIPVISDLLLGSHNPDRRADLIDQAYLETDPASWRPERWLGWTAWKPPFAIEPLHDASSRLNDRASLVELARQDGYIYLTRLVPLQTVLGLRSRLLAICSRLGLVDSRGRWCGGSLGVCPGDRPHSDPRWIRLQQEALVLEEFRALEDHPAIRTVLENILGDDVNGGQGSVCRLAPPGAPATGPHRDYQYLGRSTSLWTAWLPLGYCPMALGPLAVLPGSHRLSGSTCGEDADEAAWLAADMAPGDVLLFNALTLHRACPNVTQRRVRISADFRYAPHCS
jgi:SAM-dependent methyltransferase